MENKKILFSPIGSTDPISNMRDGGMLHICRIHKPDKVYLYLTKEMLSYHLKDDRYRKAILKLGEFINHNFEIEVIEDEDMKEVQLFDIFVSKFEEIIGKIRTEENVGEILVNISSGTPAMKSALQIISMLNKGITAYQVSTPSKSSNKNHEDKDTYDFDLQWEYNEDNSDFINRCEESKARDMLDRIRKENIIKLINAYDYEAALVMVKELSKEPSKRLVDAIELAAARKRLDIHYVNIKKKELDLNNWFPIVDDRAMKEYEYIMSMEIKLKKGQYVDFIRDITPIYFSLSEKVLKKYCKISFDDIGEKRNDTMFIKLDKLKELGINPNKRWSDNTFISSAVILYIMKEKKKEKKIEDKLIEILEAIRIVEEKVRNMAAHQIIGLNEDSISKKIDKTPSDIMKNIYKLAEYADIKINNEAKNTYDLMNNDIIEILKL